MTKSFILLTLSVLLFATACRKSSTDPSVPEPEKVTFNVRFSMDTAIGTITQKPNADTFIVDLRVQENLDSVAVIIHLDTSYRSSIGTRINDSTYAAIIDISNNGVANVKITSPEDSTKNYSIGFKYIIHMYNTDNGISGGFMDDLFVRGDTIYIATAEGLSISTNGGTSFKIYTSDNGLISSYQESVVVTDTRIFAGSNSGLDVSKDQGKTFKLVYNPPTSSLQYVNNIQVEGNMVYGSTSLNGIAISSDSGETFITNKVSTSYNSNVIYSMDAYANNVYVGSNEGLYISTDKGNTFSFTEINNLGFITINSVFTENANTIYVGLNAIDGVYASYDAGKTFTSLHCPSKSAYSIYAKGDNIYVGYIDGLFISADKGKHFSTYFPSTFTYKVFVQGNDVYTLSSLTGLTVMKAR
jgi:hypothetical protein